MLGLDNPIHILFLLILVLLVFGAKRLPEIGRSLGSGMRGFKDSLSGETSHAELSATALDGAAAAAPAATTQLTPGPRLGEPAQDAAATRATGG
jgi:sec-independent protein translocase protein TatA